jgi:hypothetical protein
MEVDMRIGHALLSAFAAMLLMTPSSFAQYTKVQVIFLRNIQDVRDNLKPDKERNTILDAAREVVRNADNLLSGHCNYWRNLQHDGRDKILSAQDGVKQSAQSLRECADALVRTIEANGGPANDCEKTLQAIESLTKVVDSYMATVEQTKQWFGTERQRLNQLDEDLAMRAVGENSRLFDAETAEREAATALQNASQQQSAAEAEHQKASQAVFDAFKKWSEEKDLEKASALAANLQRLFEDARRAYARLTETQGVSDRAAAAFLQAERDVRTALANHTKTMEALMEIGPSVQRLDQWATAFEAGCNGR